MRDVYIIDGIVLSATSENQARMAAAAIRRNQKETKRKRKLERDAKLARTQYHN